jgi:hypothetical protein
MTARPCVVILTGGALPGQDTAVPHPNDIDLAWERGRVDPASPEIIDGLAARRIAYEAFRIGWHQAALLHRVIAVYLLDDDRNDADRFARFMTAEVDPAYVMRAALPLDELLRAYENSGGRIIP